MKKPYRFIQDDFTFELEGLPENWNMKNNGCGVSSVANCLYNLGFDVDPIIVARKIYIDKYGDFDNTYLVSNGTRSSGIIYAIDRFKNEDKFPIDYYIMKVNFDNPESHREELVHNLKNGYLAIIHIGPVETPNRNGHYSVVSDVDADGNFYIIDSSSKMDDSHMKKPFSYDFIIKNIFGRKDSFNFLFVRRV